MGGGGGRGLIYFLLQNGGGAYLRGGLIEDLLYVKPCYHSCHCEKMPVLISGLRLSCWVSDVECH